ncbi:MAG: flagellar protein FlgN [Proteobacteria bacterium]|nr:flagellar protein FlgN [Burkholderiales bacterium]
MHFVAGLRAEALAFEGFVDLLRAEQSALAARDTDTLMGLAQAKSERIVSLNEFARRRAAFLAAHSYVPDRAGMAQWLHAHAGADEAALTRLWRSLLDTAMQAQATNRENGVLIETRLQHNQQLLAALTSAGQPALYGPDGHSHVGNTGRDRGTV